MKKNKFLIFFLAFCLIILSGCSNKKGEDEQLKEKIIQELDYLDTQIVSIINRLNNVSLQNYNISSEEVNLGEESKDSSSKSEERQNKNSSENESKESTSQSETENSQGNNSAIVTQLETINVLDTNFNDIDWKTIKSEIETLNDSFGVILTDLSSKNVQSNDILEFSATLNDSIISIKNEDKKESLINVAKLYSYIPKYEEQIEAENSIKNIKETKANLINAYSILETDNWPEIEKYVNNCEESFKNIINDVNYVKTKEYKVNKTYALIKELQNSLEYKDKELFIVKYKNLMENINVF